MKNEIAVIQAADLSFQTNGVSNSEAQGVSTCEGAWCFGYHPEAKLTPITMGPARIRGIAGHKALEFFYGALRDDDPYERACKATLDIIEDMGREAYLTDDMQMLEVWAYLKRTMPLYFDYYKSDIEDWEILELEAFHYMEWPGKVNVYLPMRLDMTIYQKRGKYDGETSPVDHKFTRNFWNQYKLRLNTQLPNYIRALRQTRYAGYPNPIVKRSIVNIIRTGASKDAHPWEMFKRDWVPYQSEAAEKIFKNHLKWAERADELKRMPLWEAIDDAKFAWGNSACDYCDFKSICASYLEGGDMQMTAALEYKRNESYGYASLQEVLSERTPIER